MSSSHEASSDAAVILELQTLLDREDTSSYSLALTAADRGSPFHTTTLNISITISDTNDNQPRFSQDVYEVNVMENDHLGDIIAIVTASDRDAGINGDVLYTLVTESRDEGMFEIDDVTGENEEIMHVYPSVNIVYTCMLYTTICYTIHVPLYMVISVKGTAII